MFYHGIMIAVITLFSRISGLCRELFIAWMFGTANLADSVYISFRLPNLFRKIFGEGALASVFIPIFNEKLIISKKSASYFSGCILVLLIIVLIILVVFLEIFMPNLMLIIAPGFCNDYAKYNITILLCRITIPYLFFISITAFFGSILNSLKMFIAFAITPIIFNVAVIFFTMLLNNYIISTISVAISLIFAGFIQLVFVYFVIKNNFDIKINYNFCNKDTKKFFKNIVPAIITFGIQQLNLFISQSFASFLPSAISILSYSDRIFQFPLSIVGVTFSTVLLPELSKIYCTNDNNKAKYLVDKSIKIGILMSVPSTIGIIILSKPIIHVIYEHGAFINADTILTAKTLACFALGLPALILSRIILPVFYANQDTKTPLKITIVSLLINSIFTYVLMLIYGVTGIALGSSITAWFSLLVLKRYIFVYYNFGKLTDFYIFIFKILFNTLIMSIIIITIYYKFYCSFYSMIFLYKILLLFVTILIGVFSYFLMCYILNVNKNLFFR